MSAPRSGPSVSLILSANEGDEGFSQPLAGGELWSARPLAPGARSARREMGGAARSARSRSWQPVFDGEALDMGRSRRVVARLGVEHGDREISFEDGERFWIAADGSEIRRHERDGPAPPDAVERALGAPLALALAVNGTYLLHASALVIGDRVVAFTAASGAGKSTLAAAAAARPEIGFDRVADDILPVRLAAEGVALPHFPQLKLPAGEGYPATAPPRLPLAALVELDREPPSSSPPRLERRRGAASALALARATVAARLFDESLLAPHLAACAVAAESLVVARLCYPSGVERLAGTLEVLARELG